MNEKNFRLLQIETEFSLAHFGAENPRQEAEMLFERAFGMSRLDLFMKKDEQPDPAQKAELDRLLLERLSGRPIQYVLGEADFMGLRLAVDERVLIPRPETEELAALGIELLRAAGGCGRGLRVLDLCTGSGAIACAVSEAFPEAEITASDISEDALALAALNFKGRANIMAVRSNLFEELSGPYDMILSNPPYIPSDTVEALESVVKDHEPHLALDGGADGLDIVRRIISRAPEMLAPGGSLLMEIGDDQGEAAAELALGAGLKDVGIVKDAQGRDRMLRCRAPRP